MQRAFARLLTGFYGISRLVHLTTKPQRTEPKVVLAAVPLLTGFMALAQTSKHDVPSPPLPAVIVEKPTPPPAPPTPMKIEKQAVIPPPPDVQKPDA